MTARGPRKEELWCHKLIAACWLIVCVQVTFMPQHQDPVTNVNASHVNLPGEVCAWDACQNVHASLSFLPHATVGITEPEGLTLLTATLHRMQASQMASSRTPSLAWAWTQPCGGQQT